MTEQWTRWEPLQDLGKKYDLDYIIDSYKGGLKFVFSAHQETEKKVEVHFEEGVDAYRIADEEFQHDILVKLREAYNKEFYEGWTFFRVTNSRYLHWLEEEEGPGSFGPDWFKHFCFITSNRVIDVAVNYEPNVRFID